MDATDRFSITGVRNYSELLFDPTSFQIVVGARWVAGDFAHTHNTQEIYRSIDIGIYMI